MRARPIALILLSDLLLAGAPALRAQGGHWEFSGHCGAWTLNVLKGTAEDLLGDAMKSHLREKILESINEVYPAFNSTSYDQGITFDSSGHDFGAGVRWYPGGLRGSFSLGLAVEKCDFKVGPTATVQMGLQDLETLQTGVFNGSAAGTARIDALSFLLTCRWDIFPSAAVHPYITFGGGISTSKALDDSTVAYAYAGQVTGSGIPETAISGGETKTLRQLKDEALNDAESDVSLPNFLPFVQLNLGLKVRLTKMFHAFVDVGVLDGFIASAGLAIRI
jgi:hypothetical protein